VTDRIRLIVEIDAECAGYSGDAMVTVAWVQRILNADMDAMHPVVSVDPMSVAPQSVAAFIAQEKADGRSKIDAMKNLRYWHEDTFGVFLGLKQAHELVLKEW